MIEMLPIYVSLLVLFCASSEAEYQFKSSLSYEEHPFYTLPQFSSFSPSPAVMKKYHSIIPSVGRMKADRMKFLPSTVSYKNVLTGETFCRKTDVLATEYSYPERGSSEEYYMYFELYKNAKVTVLIGGTRLNERLIGKVQSGEETLDISGVPEEWGHDFTLVQLDHNETEASSEELDKFFSDYDIAYELKTPSDLKFYLPNPRSIKMNGHDMKRFTILFSEPDTDAFIPFPVAQVPGPFESPITGETVDPSTEIPVRNKRCPEWVHDLYVVKSDTGGEDIGEPVYWRTWHPIVDIIYWCNFNHEHGAHPGSTYRPKFGYTAWKTPDNRTEHGRQDESHNGFKIIPFQTPDDDRSIIITAHMHLSLPTRFRERRHTVIFAVVGADGILQAEVSMKADFGALTAHTESSGRAPISDKDQAILDDLHDQKRRIASRRVNVINIDENYPDSIDHKYKILKLPLDDPSGVKGVYEQWMTSLNSCVSQERRFGFILDVQDPASSMRYPTEDEMCWLDGHSMTRFVKVFNFEFGSQHCEFREGSYDEFQNEGFFYTDPYFDKMKKKKGKHAIRQFIAPDFSTLKFPDGSVERTDFWDGYLSYAEPNHRIHPTNIDGAVDKREN